MKKILLLIGCCIVVIFSTAQNKYTLSGYINDSLSGETLIGASITINGHGKGVNSNQYGFYSITLPEGTYPVIVSFVGYQAQQLSIVLTRNTVLNFSLLQRSVLQEVIVSSRRKDGNVENAQMGRIDRMLASTGKSSLIAFRTMVNPDSLTTVPPRAHEEELVREGRCIDFARDAHRPLLLGRELAELGHTVDW